VAVYKKQHWYTPVIMNNARGDRIEICRQTAIKFCHIIKIASPKITIRFKLARAKHIDHIKSPERREVARLDRN